MELEDQKFWQRYFFHIGFCGTNYHGWQRQAKVISVQSVLEDTLSRIFKVPTTIYGCGRTDTGVHASQYFFHVDIENEWNFDLLYRLNKSLPEDIAIFDIIPIDGSLHARFDATKRTYDYFIHTYKDPFLQSISSLYLKTNLDFNKMNTAVTLLTKYDDFRAFCKSPDRHENTKCKVSTANLYINESGDRIRFQISSNRFLGSMIRIIVKKLLDIGNGELSVDEFESYLINKTCSKKSKLVFPQGLYLSKVTYPFLDLKPRANFLKILENNVDEWQHV